MTDILITKKNIILDATILSTLMSCARLTDFRFNHDLVSISGKSSSLEMGSLVHTILEWNFKARIGGSSRTDAKDIGYIAGREYISGFDISNKYILNESERGMMNTSSEDIQLVYDTMDQYFEYWRNDYWIPLDIEDVKSVILYEDDEIRILWKAKFDLTVDTNDGIYPVDHKTMRQRRDTNKKNNQFKGQCIVMKTRGVIINKIGFQKTLKASEKFTRPLIPYSIADLTEWSQITVPFWAKMMLVYAETGYWPPNFTHCENKFGNCAFNEICDADSHMREEELRISFTKGKHWDPTNE